MRSGDPCRDTVSRCRTRFSPAETSTWIGRNLPHSESLESSTWALSHCAFSREPRNGRLGSPFSRSGYKRDRIARTRAGEPGEGSRRRGQGSEGSRDSLDLPRQPYVRQGRRRREAQARAAASHPHRASCLDYAQRDSKRLFTQAQRRLVWHSSNHDCGICGKVIESWDDFAADHVKPHSRGGSTALANAEPVHRRCNSRKENRTARWRKGARQ